MFRIFFLAVLSLAIPTLSACAVVYKLPTRQGNVIDQKQLDQLKLGMSREQVHFLLGTPVASSGFAPDRWDYFGYYKPPRGTATTRTVTLYFDGDKLARVEGTQLASNNELILGTPDLQTMKEAAKKSVDESPDEEQEKTGGRSRPSGH
jgi:outer membrane protein assembly factor BamE (lipoprotein component of BamABCDE complex)